jgi:hypothetical protein
VDILGTLLSGMMETVTVYKTEGTECLTCMYQQAISQGKKAIAEWLARESHSLDLLGRSWSSRKKRASGQLSVNSAAA